MQKSVDNQANLNKLEKESSNGNITRESVDWLLSRIVQLPKNWLIISSILIILSTCEVTFGKEFSFKFKVTNTTAVFLALIWLPSTLKIFALSGGAVKTPAGEIDSSGMMPMLKSLTGDSLGFLIEQTKLAEEVAPPQQQLEMRQIRHEWQKVYANSVPSEEVQMQLWSLAQRYKEIRESMPYGAQRTFEMESIAGQMRALASKVKFSIQEVKNLLQSHDQGKRLLGLSIAEKSQETIYFDEILHLINYSETAFEQTCALRAMEKIVSKLNIQQKQHLQKALLEQRDYNQEKKHWIKPESNRWLISGRLLSALQ